jgi:hypothetical protein
VASKAAAPPAPATNVLRAIFLSMAFLLFPCLSAIMALVLSDR